MSGDITLDDLEENEIFHQIHHADFNIPAPLEILDLTYDVSNEPNQSSSMENGTANCNNEYCVSDEDLRQL
ncbi:hypothetical protein CEXT_724471 [Caerostris extrusa]|uniref:Uncharacterized protein n=1 Tax=Caerostris extrusa TaxID=172846 RepID=A0AAV4QQU0_CAEEX|nr:hypothetical protein CEXT_724471 [Caerostris extrusa]